MYRGIAGLDLLDLPSVADLLLIWLTTGSSVTAQCSSEHGGIGQRGSGEVTQHTVAEHAVAQHKMAQGSGTAQGGLGQGRQRQWQSTT